MLARLAFMSSKALAAPGRTQTQMIHKPLMHTRSAGGLGRVARRPPLISRAPTRTRLLQPAIVQALLQPSPIIQRAVSVMPLKHVRLATGLDLALCEPDFTHPELTQGIRLLTNILSEEECERLRGALELLQLDGPGVRNLARRELGDAEDVVRQCEARVKEAIEQLFPGQFMFFNGPTRLRWEPSGCKSSWHADKPGKYSIRVCVRVPLEDSLSGVQFRRRDQHQPEGLYVGRGEAYFMRSNVGDKSSGFQHTTLNFSGLTIIIDVQLLEVHDVAHLLGASVTALRARVAPLVLGLEG